MADWKSKASADLAEAGYAHKKPNDSSTKGNSSWQSRAKADLKSIGYEHIPLSQRKYTLKSIDGSKDFGEVSYDAYIAIQNGSLSKYKPSNENEANVLKAFGNQNITIPISNNKTINIKYRIADKLDKAFNDSKGKDKYKRAKALDKAISDMRLSKKELNSARSYAGVKKVALMSSANGKNSWVKELSQPIAKFGAGVLDSLNNFKRWAFYESMGTDKYFSKNYAEASKYYAEHPDELGNDFFNPSVGDYGEGSGLGAYISDTRMQNLLAAYDDTNKVTKFISDAGFRSAGQMLGAAATAEYFGFNNAVETAGNVIKGTAAATKAGQAISKVANLSPKIANVAEKGMGSKIANAAINKVNSASIGAAAKFLNPLDNPTTVIMGVNAAQDKYIELIKQGVDEKAARKNAALTGYINTITEKMGYSGKAKNPNSFLQYILDNVSEGSEELINSPLERLADNATGTAKHKFFGNNGIIDPKDMAVNFVGGFVGGAVMGAPGEIARAPYQMANTYFSVRNKINNNKASSAVKTASTTDDGSAGGTRDHAPRRIPAQKRQNTFTDELSEVREAGAVTRFAPKGAGAAVTSLENSLVEAGVSDELRQSIVGKAATIETVVNKEKAVETANKGATSITNDAVNNIAELTKTAPDYWNIYNTNLSVLTSPTAKVDENYIKAYSDSFIGGMEQGNNSLYAALAETGYDVRNLVSDYILTGKAPENITSNTKVMSALDKTAGAILGVAGNAANQLARAHQQLYGNGNPLSAQVALLNNGDFSVLNANTADQKVSENAAASVESAPSPSESATSTVDLTPIGEKYFAYGDQAEMLADRLKLTPARIAVDGKDTTVVSFPTSALPEYQQTLEDVDFRVRAFPNAQRAEANPVPTETAPNSDSDGSQIIKDFEKAVQDIENVDDETALENVRQGKVILVSPNTSAVILKSVEGCKDLPVIIRYDALYLAMRESGVIKGHYHNLGSDIVEKLPQMLENPQAIIHSTDNRITIISADNNTNKLVSVELNAVKDLDNSNKAYNIIITMFNAKDNYIKNQINRDGTVLDYQKEDLSQVNPKLFEWLGTINDKSSNEIITQPLEKVNTNATAEPNKSTEPKEPDETTTTKQREAEKGSLRREDFNVVKTKHTKTGEDLWVVKPKERLSKEEFNNLRAEIKSRNGYWSTFVNTDIGRGGFIFKKEPSNIFADSDNKPLQKEKKNDTIQVENKDAAVDQAKEEDNNVHTGVLGGEVSDSPGERKPEGLQEPGKEREAGSESRENRGIPGESNGPLLPAEEKGQPSKESEPAGAVNDGARERDDSERLRGRGIDGPGNVSTVTEATAETEATPEATAETEAEINTETDNPTPVKVRDYSISKATASELDNSSPSMKNNLDAIKVLHELEASNKTPTKAQQAILAKYKGWGGLTSAFAYHDSELREVMSEEEYNSAKATVNDAYFTPTTIIDSVFKAVKQLGFSGGNVLEPSMGVGNFFGKMPAALKNASSLYGVEIDSISGRIAKYLYPSANISISPFQDATYKDGSFDLILGNVPFGEVKYKYKGAKYLIHDYFFVKAMDKLNDGGVMMLLTSKGTLDKLDNQTRLELARKGRLIAAYRLPASVFSKSANANVVTDLIIMQKGTQSGGEAFTGLGSIDGVTVNEYFVNHPENIIGKFDVRRNRFGKYETTVTAKGDTIAALDKAIKKLPKNLLNGVETVGTRPITEGAAQPQEFYLNDKGKVEYVDSQTGEVKNITGKNATVASDYMAVKTAYKQLLSASLREDTAGAEKARTELNKAYDAFAKKHGSILKNRKILASDTGYYMVSGLEVQDTKTKKIAKSETFTRDTLSRSKPLHADNTLDALSISVGETGRVDIQRIASLTGISEDEAVKQLDDRIVFTPDGEYELNEVYLSGDVRSKYNAVKGKPGFEKNEKMLKAVMPEDIPAKNITPQFGAGWIEPKYVAQFLKELLHLYQVPTVNYDPTSGTWSLGNNSWGDHTLMTKKYGTRYVDAMKLAEKALNMRNISVRDRDGNIIASETRAAQQKAEDIKAAFEEWCFKDKDRRKDLVDTFNTTFNSNRNMDFSELSKYLTFEGLSETFVPRDYQRRVVARAVFNGNTLLAHGVGTGKTAEMIMIAMELRRMGLAKKNMMVVPNHKVTDFRNDILKTYPGAKIICLEKTGKSSISPQARKSFYAQVAANDWDIVVIPHSAFQMLDVSDDIKASFIQNQVAELEEVLTAAQLEKGSIDGRFIKQLEKQKENLKEKLKAVTEGNSKDTGTTFDELGIDSLFVDEAHNFKNLPFYTKLSRVAGVSSSVRSNKSGRATRAENMYMITDYLNRTGGRVNFATATPITNSMSEIYNMLKFLRPDILKDAGIQSFDAWAAMFGSIINQAEVDTTGRSMRMKERFSKFKNVAQMVEQFRRVADVLKTGDVIQTLPKATREDVITKSNPIQEEFLDILDKMVDQIRSGGQKDSKLNMLTVTKAGQMAAIDLRFVKSFFDGKYTDEDLNLPNNRITEVVKRVHKEYVDSNDRKGTQFIFCDEGIHDDDTHAYNFHAYGELVNKLVASGIPREEIAIAQDYTDKGELSGKMNTGEIRVLIGSTQVMGEGMNAQNKAVALHHMTVPYRPSDIEQREGRIIRYGNENKDVRIYRYIQERSYDSYQWQMQERKSSFINQALSGGTVEELEEMSDFQLSAREAKAIASGNPLLLKKIEVEDKLNKLKSIRQKFTTDKLEMQDRLAELPQAIATKEQRVESMSKDLSTVNAHSADDFSMTVGKTVYTERAEAAEAIKKALQKAPRNGTIIKIGSYRGLDLKYRSSLEKGTTYILEGAGTYTVQAGDSISGNITRIQNLAEKIEKNRDTEQFMVDSYKDELKTLEKEVTATFPQEQELNDLQAQLNSINTELGIGDDAIDLSEVVIDNESDAKASITNDWSEDNGTGEDILPGNRGRGDNESSRKQTRSLHENERAPKERQQTAQTITEKGQAHKHEVGSARLNLIDESAHNADMKSIIAENKTRGLKTRFFVGAGEYRFDSKKNIRINGLIDGDTVYLRYDAKVSPQKLNLHENVHKAYKTARVQKAKNIILNSLSEIDKRNILNSERYARYMDMYKGNTDSVYEEFVADTLAGMNEYSAEYSDLANAYWNGEELVDNYSPGEYNELIDTGGTNETVLDNIGLGDENALRFSVEKKRKWHTDLSKTALHKLNEKIKRDARTGRNPITDGANWLYTDIDGVEVFAIYSTTDTAEPTLLYEAKGERGEFERELLLKILEVADNGGSNDRQPDFVNRVSKRDWLQNVRYNNDSVRAMGAGGDNQNASILRGQSKRKPSRAFRNVLNNIFRIQEQSPGSDNGVEPKFSLDTLESDEAELTPERRREIEEQFNKDRVGVQKESRRNIARDFLVDVKNFVTRVFPEIPERGEMGKYYAEFRKEMVQWRSGAQTAMFKVQQKLNNITKELTPEEYRTFSELVYFLDLQEEAQTQKDKGYEEILLPNSISPHEVDLLVEELNKEATDNVKKAIERRKATWKEMIREYTELNQYCGFDTKNRFNRQNYYRHEVISKMSDKYNGASKGAINIKAGRGWLHERKGSTQAINTDFLAVEYKSLLEMQYDIYVANILGKIKDNYDIKPKLEHQAFQHNKDALQEIINNEARGKDGEIQLDDKGNPDSATFRQQKWYNQRIMFGFSNLFFLAKSGALPTLDGSYANVIDALSRQDLSVPGLYKYIGALAAWDGVQNSDDEQAQIGARTVMKYTSQKKAWTKELLGRDYQTWETLAKSMDDTHSIFQPRRGNYFFTKETIDEEAFNQAFNSMITTLASGAAGVDSTAEIQKAFADYSDTVRLMGAAYEQWVLPNELITVMDRVANPPKAGLPARGARAVLTAWKGWSTSVNPLRTVKFGIRNMVGDLDAVIAGDPRVLRMTSRAVKEIYDAMAHKQYSKEFMEWVDRGGWSSMIFANEMDTELRDKLFDNLKEKTGKSVLQMPVDLVNGYLNGVEAAHNFREAILRYAAYLHFKDTINRNGGNVKDYVASNKWIVDGLHTVEDKSFQLSNDLLGAYDEVSAMGQTLRRYVVPFYSFTETNFKRYFRVFENVIRSDASIPVKVGRLILKVVAANLLALIFAAWNRLIMKDADDKLPKSTREVPHITLFTLGDDVYAFRQLGSFNELLEWVGLEDYLGSTIEGRSPWESPAEPFAQAFNKAYSMLTPFATGTVNVLRKQDAYPDFFKPRTIRDRGEYIANSWGVLDIYKMATGKPIKDWAGPLKSAVIYSYDYQESAYWDIIDAKKRFQGKDSGTVYGATDKSNALYYMKQAIRYKDQKAALKYLDKYFEAGGTGKGVASSIAMLDPMYGFTGKNNTEQGERFVNSLSTEDRERLKIAQHYYNKEIMLPDDVSARLNKKGISDTEAKNLLTNYIKAKCK